MLLLILIELQQISSLQWARDKNDLVDVWHLSNRQVLV